MKKVKYFSGWVITIFFACALSFVIYNGQDLSSIYVILDKKFGENYEVTERSSETLDGKKIKVFRVTKDEHQYIMYFKYSGFTTFSDHELFRMESVKNIPLD